MADEKKLTHERFNSPLKVVIDGVVLYDPARDGDDLPENFDELVAQLEKRIAKSGKPTADAVQRFLRQRS